VRTKKSGTACYKNPFFHGKSPDRRRNTETASLKWNRFSPVATLISIRAAMMTDSAKMKNWS